MTLCERSDIQTAFYSGSTNGVLLDQHLIPGQIILSKIGIEGIPVFNVENACASGSSAFHLGMQMIKAGSCDVALAIGSEKMNIPDKKRVDLRGMVSHAHEKLWYHPASNRGDIGQESYALCAQSFIAISQTIHGR